MGLEARSTSEVNRQPMLYQFPTFICQRSLCWRVCAVLLCSVLFCFALLCSTSSFAVIASRRERQVTEETIASIKRAETVRRARLARAEAARAAELAQAKAETVKAEADAALARAQSEKGIVENAAATKLQAWARGIEIRKAMAVVHEANIRGRLVRGVGSELVECAYGMEETYDAVESYRTDIHRERHSRCSRLQIVAKWVFDPFT